MSENRKALPYGLKDLREASRPNQQKISAFQIAPTRKTAFEKAKEQAQQKAEKEAAETAAAYQDFIAEYGTNDDHDHDHDRRRTTTFSRRDESFKHQEDRNLQVNQQPRKRTRDDNGTNHERQHHHSPVRFDDHDSEEEERERRRLKLTSSAKFLNELKQTNRKRDLSDRSRDRDNRDTKYSDARTTPAHAHAHAHAQPGGSHTAPHNESESNDPQTAVNNHGWSNAQTPDQSEQEESSDDIDFYRTKPASMTAVLPLGKISKARLRFLLDNVTARRGSIARVTAFAMTHAISITQVVELICDSLKISGVDWKLAIARLWCISDILHNSWIPIPNVWKYRSHFETALMSVFEALKAIGNEIESRLRRENFRALVITILEVWNTWICFSDGVVDQFFDAFDDQKVEEEVLEEAKQQKKSGGWKKFEASAQDDDPVADDISIDGEAIDLDGEEIDLDGEVATLPGAAEPEEVIGISQAAETQDHVASPREKPVMTIPKIKMSFNKIKLPARAKQEPVKVSESESPAEATPGQNSTFLETRQNTLDLARGSDQSTFDTSAQQSVNGLSAYELLEKESSLGQYQSSDVPHEQMSYPKEEGQRIKSLEDLASASAHSSANAGDLERHRSEQDSATTETQQQHDWASSRPKDRKRQRRSAADFM